MSHHAARAEKLQNAIDVAGLALAAVCLLHCLALPLLVLLGPIFGSGLLTGPAFHQWMLLVVAPTAMVALLLGCRRHKDKAVFLLGASGLAALVLGIVIGHEIASESFERIATLLGGALLTGGHSRNYLLCRRASCDHAGEGEGH